MLTVEPEPRVAREVSAGRVDAPRAPAQSARVRCAENEFSRARKFWRAPRARRRVLRWPLFFSVWFVAPLWGAAGSGCGYQLLRPDAMLPGVSRVALRGFRNATLEPGADALLSDAFSRALLRSGALRLVSDASRADLQLDGVVRALATQSRSLSPLSFALEYEMRLEISLRARRGDADLFAAPRVFAARERYLASAEPEVTRTNREEALRRLASVLATRAFDALHAELAQPAQSDEPAQPAASAQPDEFVQSDASAQSTQPAAPAQSAQPDEPAQPDESAQPAASAQPDEFVQSDASAQSTQPAAPAQSAQPDEPAQPDKDAQR